MVVFKFRDDEKCGMIQIVDAYGTFEQEDEPSYDICVEEENCLYKRDGYCKESMLNRYSTDTQQIFNRYLFGI